VFRRLFPFINEPEIERTSRLQLTPGARSAFSVVLRLRGSDPLFSGSGSRRHFPDRAARVMARMHDMRGSKDYDALCGQRHAGDACAKRSVVILASAQVVHARHHARGAIRKVLREPLLEISGFTSHGSAGTTLKGRSRAGGQLQPRMRFGFPAR